MEPGPETPAAASASGTPLPSAPKFFSITQYNKSLERLLDMGEADVLLCGHTHLPYHRVLPSGRHVVNAGSVGKPKDGDPRAGYVVLHVEGSTLTVEFVRVPYDVEYAARVIEASEMPHEYARMLREGRG